MVNPSNATPNLLCNRDGEKEVINHGNLDLEDKDFGAVDFHGGGYVGPQYIFLYGARTCRRDVGDGDGTGNDVIYGSFLVGTAGDGCPIPDLEGLGKPLGKLYSGHSLYNS